MIDPDLDVVLRELSGALSVRLGDRFAGLWLYGSQARGDARPSSDIDVVLLLNGMGQPGREIDRVSDILADLNLKYGALVSMLPFEAAELTQAQGPFWRNVIRDGRAA